MEFTVILEEDEKGFIVASCPSLPSCHSQGKTEAEALANVRVPAHAERPRVIGGAK